MESKINRLIVDDSIYGRVLQYHLRRSDLIDVNTSFVQSIQTAMNKFDEDEFNLIICDYMLMPSKYSKKLYESGLEFYKFLRKKNRNIPFVLITEFNLDLKNYPELKSDLNFNYFKKSKTTIDSLKLFVKEQLLK